MDEAWRCAPITILSLPKGRSVVYFPHARRTLELSAAELAYLRSCVQFHSTEEHAEAARSKGVVPPPGLLQFLAGEGLLLTASTFLNACRTDSAWSKPGVIDRIGWVTKDRRPSLAASVASFARNCRQYGRAPQFVVIDDSRTCSAEAALGETFASARIRRAVYGDRASREEYCRALSESCGCPLEIVRFGLLGPEWAINTVGAARNALLLTCAGREVFCVDDDTIGLPRTAPDAQEGFACQSGDPTDFWFYPRRRNALRATAGYEADILGLHEEMLGMTLGAFLLRAIPGTNLRNGPEIPNDLLLDLFTGGSRNVLTFNGLVGESGIDTHVTLIGRGGETALRMWASEEAHHTAVSSREVIRAARQTTLFTRGFCMMTFAGVDERKLAPPFPPACRNEDGVFGAILELCQPRLTRIHLPLLLVHNRPHRARPEAPEFGTAGTVRMSDVLIALLLTSGASLAETPSAVMVKAGQTLKTFGALSSTVCRERLRELMSKALAHKIRWLIGALDNSNGAPQAWRTDLERRINAITTALTSDDFYLPCDIGAAPSDHRQQTLQTFLRAYGQLLEAWPSLFAAAEALAAEGVTCCREIRL